MLYLETRQRAIDGPFMVLKSPYMESSSHSATKRSWTVALVLLLSRDATRPTFDSRCLGEDVRINLLAQLHANHTHSHTDLEVG